MIRRDASTRTAGLSTDEAAAFWLVQMDAGRLEGSLAAEFERWRGADPAHEAAFERARGTWHLFDDVAGDAHIAAFRASALATKAERRPLSRYFLGGGIAAALVGMVVLAGAMMPTWPDGTWGRADIGRQPVPIAANRYGPSDFATARGERRRIELADGSRITLNTDSAMRVAYSADRRLITMLRGQALFEVARDRSRPFVVEAGSRQITALGTVFDVRLEADRTQVTLAEGKVVVDGRHDSAPAGAGIAPTLQSPGEELIVRNNGVQVTGRVDVERQLRWREGFAEFEAVPLSQAAEEMNRYSTSTIAVDSVAGQMKVSGIFRTGSPQRFAEIVAEILPVRTRTRPDGTIEIVGDDRQAP